MKHLQRYSNEACFWLNEGNCEVDTPDTRVSTWHEGQADSLSELGDLMGQPNWENQTIWTGDNLDIMRGMNAESVDLIYLDPPFNSNRDYAAPIGSKAAGAAFKDTWTLNDVDEAWHGEIADRDPVLYSIIDAAGQAHGKSMKSYLIMMAVRLLEMKRLLKPTGSVYLHCDATASHYLKTLMDAIFGQGNFRCNITWRRTTAKGLSFKGYPNNADTLLYYSKSDKYTWNRPFIPHDPDYIAKFYKHIEPKTGRRYALDNLVNPNMNRPNLTYEFLGVTRVWRWEKPRMQKAYNEGLIVQAKTGAVPRLKRYLDEMKGVPVDNIWDDIKPVQAKSKERTGYPTQKPLALLQRIIQASSNSSDVVLDPFCGCATACISAENENRQWVGIDISAKAFDLVNVRMRNELGLFGNVIHRDDIPKRTDKGSVPSYKTQKHTLFGRQEGMCRGCLQFFQFRNFTIDHIVPQAKGGTDHLDNLQLLCGACNSTKGSGSQEELIAKLKREGIRA